MSDPAAIIMADGRVCVIRVRERDGFVTNRGFTSPAAACVVAEAGGGQIVLRREQAERLAQLKYARWVDGDIVPSDAPAVDMTRVKARALAMIDGAAERARLAWITPGAGQALEYEATAAEATLYLADPHAAVQAGIPMLEAEVAARTAFGEETSLKRVAEVVMRKRADWTAAAAQIKRVRLEAKMRIDAATDPAEIDAALAGVEWPSPGTAIGRNVE